MPSTITHAFIGLDTIKKVNASPKRIIQKHLNNYKIYCQSMDVLYFHHLLLLKENTVQELGHRFHNENVYNCFETIINDNRKNQDEELFTFISGLITHYQADKIMHPYISFLSYNKNKIKTIDKHFEIETYLDNYFTSIYENNNYQSFKNYSFIFDGYQKCKIIEEEVNNIFKNYFKFPKMGSYYYKSIKEMHFIYKHIRYDRYGIKKVMFNLVDHNPFNIRKTKYLSYHFNVDNNEYYLNTSHQHWHNIYNKDFVSNKSFLDLYDEVTDASSIIINEVYKYIFEKKDVDLKKLIGNFSYSTGKPLD